MSLSNERQERQAPLMLAGAAFGLSLVLRQVPVLGWLVYPFQLFATLIHELGHGVTALLTGGRFLNFTIDPDTSGLATTIGGWRWLVIPAGYVGAALFGGLLLALTLRGSSRVRRGLALGLGVFFALVTLLFARNLTAIVVGGAAALALLGLWRYGSALWVTFGLGLLAIQCALNALDSLFGLTRLSAGPFKLPNDAQSMADLTRVPAVFWAVLWSLVGLAILMGSVYWSLKHRNDA